MCTFMSNLPKRSRVNQSIKKNLVLSLKPCPDKDNKPTWYRVRLLAWTSPEINNRDYPFIERFVHTIWKKNDKGFSVIDDEVTCPVTKHVHIEGNPYKVCPICKLADQYFGAWQSSGWKDREACKKNKEIGRKYQAIIPVYVVDDPNYQANNGKFKVLIFSDKKFYEAFKEKVEKASRTNCVFNGKNAVDCCLHMTEVEEVRNPGQPNEYVYKQKVIDKVTFTTKPYDIPSITKEWVTNSGFDEEYYTTSTLEELQAFYDRHFKISNDDIPEEDTMSVIDTSVTETKSSNINLENTSIPSNDVSTDDINSFIDDLTPVEDSVEPEIKSEEVKTDNLSVDSDIKNVEELIADLDI